MSMLSNGMKTIHLGSCHACCLCQFTINALARYENRRARVVYFGRGRYAKTAVWARNQAGFSEYGRAIYRRDGESLYDRREILSGLKARLIIEEGARHRIKKVPLQQHILPSLCEPCCLSTVLLNIIHHHMYLPPPLLRCVTIAPPSLPSIRSKNRLEMPSRHPLLRNIHCVDVNATTILTSRQVPTACPQNSHRNTRPHTHVLKRIQAALPELSRNDFHNQRPRLHRCCCS